MGDSTYIQPHPQLQFMTKASWSAFLWKQLHDRPVETGGDLVDEQRWIDGFCAAIPCDDCRAHFARYVEQHPPDFSSVDRYFFYTWKAHNDVRRRLGYPIVKWQWGEPPLPLEPDEMPLENNHQ